MDLDRLAAAARLLPGVVHVEEALFACAVESTRRMAATIRDLGLNRVVVAACSPRTHEAVFREVVAAADLNPGYFALANIREQCAWVHQEEPAAALEKAQQVLAMAVRRAGVLTALAAPKLSGDSPGPGPGGRRGRDERGSEPGPARVPHLPGGARPNTWGAWPGSSILPWRAPIPRNSSRNSSPRC